MSYSFSLGRAVLWVKIYRFLAVESEVCHQWMLHKRLADSRVEQPQVFTLLKMPLQLDWWQSSAGLIEHNQLPSGMLWDCVFCIYCLRTIWRDRVQDLQISPSIQQHSQGRQRSTCVSGESQRLFLLPTPEWFSQKLNRGYIQSSILWIIFYWLLWTLKVLLTSMDEGLLTVLWEINTSWYSRLARLVFELTSQIKQKERWWQEIISSL